METIENEKLRVSLTRYAAAIHKIEDIGTGKVYNLVLPSEEDHLTDPSYAGNTVGSYAGRIGNANLVIDGRCYDLDRNDRNASLHGGLNSLRREWRLIQKDELYVAYETHLHHLEDGLPGERTFQVKYSLEGNELRVLLSAFSDRNTYFNLTNHTYISIEEDMRKAWMRIDADRVVLNDLEDIPKEVVAVDGTIFDFRQDRAVGNLNETEELCFSRGLNNTYLMNGNMEIYNSRHRVEIYTDAPTAVFYMGGYLESPFSGLAVEPENYVLLSDSVEGMLGQERNIIYRFD